MKTGERLAMPEGYFELGLTGALPCSRCKTRPSLALTHVEPHECLTAAATVLVTVYCETCLAFGYARVSPLDLKDLSPAFVATFNWNTLQVGNYEAGGTLHLGGSIRDFTGYLMSRKLGVVSPHREIDAAWPTQLWLARTAGKSKETP